MKNDNTQPMSESEGQVTLIILMIIIQVFAYNCGLYAQTTYTTNQTHTITNQTELVLDIGNYAKVEYKPTKSKRVLVETVVKMSTYKDIYKQIVKTRYSLKAERQGNTLVLSHALKNKIRESGTRKEVQEQMYLTVYVPEQIKVIH